MELLFILMKVGAVLLAVYYARRRVRGWRRKTEELGFQFADQADPAFVKELTAFRLFEKARPKSITNLMRASAGGLRLSIFDHINPSNGVKATMIYFRSPLLELPRFTMRPESMWHRLFGWFGYQDIDFESHRKFSRRYLLRGEDEEAIREIFYEDVLDYFQEQAGFQVQGAGDKLLVFRSAKQVEPDKLRPFLQEGFRVYDLFKSSSSEWSAGEFDMEEEGAETLMAEIVFGRR